MIDAKLINAYEPVASFQEQGSGKRYDVAIARLRNKVQGTPTTDAPLHRPLVEHLVATLRLGREELHRITMQFNEHLAAGLSDEQSVLIRPVMCVWFKDKSWEIIDGQHTYIAAFLSGLTTYRSYSIKRQIWTPFIVKNYEERFDANIFVKPEKAVA